MLTDRAPPPDTAITVGPTTLSSNAPFGGVGGASGGGGGTRLLVDYPEPQRSDILDMLFEVFYAKGDEFYTKSGAYCTKTNGFYAKTDEFC